MIDPFKIKFRGKREANGEWVYGDLVHQTIWMAPMPMPMLFIRSHDSGFEHYTENQVNPKTVGQYTGRIDKNRIMVFQASICEFQHEKDGEKSTTIGRVYWCDDSLCWMVQHIAGQNWTPENAFEMLMEFDPENIKIIGNVHDNPELMEK